MGRLVGMVMTGIQLSQLCCTYFSTTLYMCFIFVASISVCKFRCCAADDIFITMVTVNPHFRTNSNPMYFCYVNSSDVIVSTSRVISTRRYPGNPSPSRPELQTSSDYPSESSVYRVDLDFSYDREFGTYDCEARTDGMSSSTSNVILLSAGTIYPATRLVTQTVNEGDGNVNIVMDLEDSIYEDYLEWLHDGSTLSTAGSPPGTYSFSRAIRKSDEGLYICYESFRWSEAFHGMQRLIVRGCQANRWGPNCDGICDNCYNGGICDDETGRCVCPPGFMGTNCLTACGPNKFGYSCEFICLARENDYGCSNHQFCLPDPYGCTCNTGLQGLGCSTTCADGKFGASCLQDCHCQVPCDSFTGECPGSCEEGWAGHSCQIPATCPNDYHGLQCVEKCHCKNDAPCDKETGECPDQECCPGFTVYPGSASCQECYGGYFGDHCQEECHCEASSCDRITGVCIGQCKPQWVEYTDCQVGLVSSKATKVNPNTPAQVNCTAEAKGFSFDNFGHALSRKRDAIDRSKISTLLMIPSSGEEVLRKIVLFQVNDVIIEEQMFCLLTSQSGRTIYAFLPVTVHVCDLPELTYPPEQVNVTSSEVTIQWIAWDPDTDVGDAPVVAYVLYYRRNSSDEWINLSIVQSAETLEYREADLDADTSYIFAVAAVREGSGGEGPRGPPLIVKTLCNVSDPVISVHAHLTPENIVNVSWQLPPGEMCSTGVTSYKVYYRVEGSIDDTPQLAGTVEDVDTRWFIIDEGLLQPESSYIFLVTVITDQESGFSETNAFQTPADTSSTPGYVLTLMVITPLVLLAALIVFFIVRFRRKNNPRNKKITKANDSEDTGYANAAIQEGPQDYIALENQSRDMSSSKYEAIHEKSQGSSSTPLQYEVTIFPQPQKQIEKFRAQTKSMEGVNTNAYDDVGKGSDSRQVSDVPKSHPSGDKEKGNSYEVPDKLEEYTGLYINMKNKSKHVPPGPIKLAEFEKFMSRNKEDFVSDIVQQFMALPSGEQYPWRVALKFQNKPRNFFKSILPYDHSRVKLDTNGSDARSDYINASYIKNHEGKMSFIAAQGPQEHTVDDFWKMVWQENVETIVMVTDISEGDKILCCSYWPSKVHMSEVYDDITVLLMESTSYTTHTIRKLNLLKGDHKTVHTVTQVQVHFWQYGSVPKEPASLISIIKKVKSLQTDGSSAPMLVHCSNGVGATGTFIAAYVLMDVVKKNKEISVFEFVKRMRDDRVDMVQTRVQYLFVFEVLLAALQSTDSEMSCDQLKKVDYSGIRQKSKKEFKVLQESIAKGQHPDSYIGSSPENQHKNRFKNLIPDDKHRPVLKSEGNSISSNSYINAFHLVNFSGREFIMTQSPLSSTVEDFWRLVYDYECTTIVMLNTVDGSDETVVQYWPGSGGTQYGYMKVECTNTTKNDMCIHREFQLSHEKVKEKSVSVNHFAFCGWSGNQPDISKLMEFIRCTGSKDGQPLLVHCMNGVGLSAVYIIVKTESKRLEKDGFVDVFQSLKKMRMNCPPAIQTEEHYTLCYQLLKDHLNNPEEYAVVY